MLPRFLVCLLLGPWRSDGEDGPWRREGGQAAEGVSTAGLRALRKQIDEGAPASQTIGTIANDVIVDGQELLTTEVIGLYSPSLK